MAVVRRLDLALAELLDRGDQTVDAGLDVELARRGDEERHVAAADEVDDPLAHVVAGQVEILADVGQPVVRCIGVVAEDRDSLAQGAVRRAVERRQRYEANRDAVCLGRDRRVHRVHHLADVGRLGSRPLVAGAKERARVLCSVDGRDEERVRRDVVDEVELPLRVRLDEAVGSQSVCHGPHRRRCHDRRWHGERRRPKACPLEHLTTVDDHLAPLVRVHALRVRTTEVC